MAGGEEFFNGLVDVLKRVPLRSNLRSEDELEEAIVPDVRAYVSERLGVSNLQEILYHHHNHNWPESKQYQNVAVLGRDNTGDIFIRHPSVGAIFIDLKLTKRRQTKAGDEGSDALTGGLQRAIGQAIIASMRHPYVISFVAHWGTGLKLRHDVTEELVVTLWTKHRVKLILRDLESM